MRFLCCFRSEEKDSTKSSTVTNSLHVPEELVILILEKLPPKSFTRFKSVCKSFHRIISTPGFLQRRILLLRSNSWQETSLAITEDLDRTYAVLESPTSSTPAKFVPFPLPPCPNSWHSPVVAGSCRGIFCLADLWTGRCILWNPTTAEWRALPHGGSRDEYVYNLGVDEYDGDLKIVKIYAFKEHNTTKQRLHFCYRASIYELSSDSWREISPMGIDKGKLVSTYTTTHSSLARLPDVANCSWMAYRWDIKTKVYVQCSIVSFDMATEAFTTFSTPTYIRTNGPPQRLFTLNGFLALSCCQLEPETNSVQIWDLLQPGVAESWTKLWTIRVPFLQLYRPLEFWNGGVVIERWAVVDDRYMWCDLSNPRGTIQALPIASRPGQFLGVLPFERTHASVAAVREARP